MVNLHCERLSFGDCDMESEARATWAVVLDLRLLFVRAKPMDGFTRPSPPRSRFHLIPHPSTRPTSGTTDPTNDPRTPRPLA